METETEAKAEKFKYVPKTDVEIHELALRYMGRGIWTSMESLQAGYEPDFSFMILKLMNPSQRMELIDERIIFYYEEIDKAGPRSVNGMPMFMSFQCLDDKDALRFVHHVEHLQKPETAGVPVQTREQVAEEADQMHAEASARAESNKEAS